MSHNILTILLLFITLGTFVWIFCSAKYDHIQVMRHARVQSALHQIPNDIMRYIAGNYATLTRAEFHCLRRLLRLSDSIIDDFRHQRGRLFDLRKSAKYLKTYRYCINQTTAPLAQANPHIHDLHAQFAADLANTLLAYTPSLRWQWALKITALTDPRGTTHFKSSHLRQYVLKMATHVRDNIAALRQYESTPA